MESNILDQYINDLLSGDTPEPGPELPGPLSGNTGIHSVFVAVQETGEEEPSKATIEEVFDEVVTAPIPAIKEPAQPSAANVQSPTIVPVPLAGTNSVDKSPPVVSPTNPTKFITRPNVNEQVLDRYLGALVGACFALNGNYQEESMHLTLRHMKARLGDINAASYIADYAKLLKAHLPQKAAKGGAAARPGDLSHYMYSLATHPQFGGHIDIPAKETAYHYRKSWPSNECIMRCLPLAILRDTSKIERNTVELCKLTHIDTRCIATTVMINVIFAALIRNVPKPCLTLIKEASNIAKKYATDMKPTPQEFVAANKHPAPEVTKIKFRGDASVEFAEVINQAWRLPHVMEGAHVFNEPVELIQKSTVSTIWIMRIFNAIGNTDPDINKIIDYVSTGGMISDVNAAIIFGMVGARLGYKKLNARLGIGDDYLPIIQMACELINDIRDYENI